MSDTPTDRADALLAARADYAAAAVARPVRVREALKAMAVAASMDALALTMLMQERRKVWAGEA